MAEGRMLKKRISESKKLGSLKSDSARLLYTWLIPWLDIEGRHLADPEIIKGHVFPKVKSMTLLKIKKLLIDLHEAGLIVLYKVDNETYLQFKKFKEFQKIREDREKKSEIPAPEEKNILILAEKERNFLIPGALREDSGSTPGVGKKSEIPAPTGENALTPGALREHSGSTPAKDKLSKDKLSKKKENIKRKKFTKTDKPKEQEKYPKDFLAFWEKYPRKVQKEDALTAWLQLKKKQRAEVMLAVGNYDKQVKIFRTETQFIMHPAKFLRPSKRRWVDYLPENWRNPSSHSSRHEELMKKLKQKAKQDD